MSEAEFNAAYAYEYEWEESEEAVLFNVQLTRKE